MHILGKLLLYYIKQIYKVIAYEIAKKSETLSMKKTYVIGSIITMFEGSFNFFQRVSKYPMK
ncbi:hypothetical protein [Lysinibacillus xylanilyticus]|uniref:hypothetical protein n=1 Tax=Lysinibacillus xylanilyticus TaxID=582475 RepID=UPI0038168139